MGTWGTALYSNDTSNDVRDMCNEVYPLVGIEEGTKLILKEYAEIVNSDIIDNDYADFWFALADWQWKHGILTDEIKNKTISLLKAHTGIEEWQESGTAADVKKRLAVMDKLLQQLKSPQPEIKIPKAKIARPKHKPGDIIIFHTCDKNHEYAETVYNIEACEYPFVYTAEIADKVPKELYPPYEAYNKYIAILCVGIEKMQHSQYVDGIFDEHSVYAFYDYISDEKPTLDQLTSCGFLPKYLRYASIEGNSIETIGWTYTFNLFAYSFRLSKNGSEQSIEKVTRLSECERFWDLFNKKNYLNTSSFNFVLFDAFSGFFEEKVRLTLAGFNYDNLLDCDTQNPPLCSKEELSKFLLKEHEEIIRENRLCD